MRKTKLLFGTLVIVFGTTINLACNRTVQSSSAYTKSTLLFEDSGTENWRDKWFLDGERATVINSPAGMELQAGPEAKNDTCHVVLWTKESFSGDVSIEYDYTRTDSTTSFVNILYFMATGQGDDEYPADISAWNDKRVVPHMRTYFKHMRTYHISYATASPEDDYIRLRRYDPARGRLKGTDIKEDYFRTGLFRTNETYRIKVIKYKERIEMHIQNIANRKEKLVCKWDASDLSTYDSGRVGFRHMYTRNAMYRNIKIWSLR